MNGSFYAQKIKEAVEMQEIAEIYGFEINRKGFMRCPFHSEKTPSLKVYPGKGGYHCFGCGAHGGVIDFVMEYFRIDFQTAIAKINTDFCLGLPIGKKIDRRQQLEISKAAFEAKKEREKAAQEIEAVKKRYENALKRFTRFDKQKTKYQPKKGETDLHPLFVEAITNIAEAEYELDCAEIEVHLKCNKK